MTYLVLGLALFFAIHSVPIAASARQSLTETLGPIGYQALFAVVSLLGLILIVMGYGHLQGAASNPLVWSPPVWTRHISLLLMLPAMIALAAAYIPSRIRTVLKHPMLVAIKIWALSHLLANGDLASLLLFGTFLAWAVVDRISVKKRSALGPLGERTGGVAGDIMAVVLGTAVYLFLLYYGHLWLFGVAPLPSLMA